MNALLCHCFFVFFLILLFCEANQSLENVHGQDLSKIMFVWVFKVCVTAACS